MFDFVKTEISYKQKDENSEKEILELKERVRDLEDKLKKSENRTYDNLGTGQRLHVSSRQIIEDDDTDHDTREQRNRETNNKWTCICVPSFTPESISTLKPWLTTSKSQITV